MFDKCLGLKTKFEFQSSMAKKVRIHFIDFCQKKAFRDEVKIVDGIKYADAPLRRLEPHPSFGLCHAGLVYDVVEYLPFSVALSPRLRAVVIEG